MCDVNRPHVWRFKSGKSGSMMSARPDSGGNNCRAAPRRGRRGKSVFVGAGARAGRHIRAVPEGVRRNTSIISFVNSPICLGRSSFPPVPPLPGLAKAGHLPAPVSPQTARASFSICSKCTSPFPCFRDTCKYSESGANVVGKGRQEFGYLNQAIGQIIQGETRNV